MSNSTDRRFMQGSRGLLVIPETPTIDSGVAQSFAAVANDVSYGSSLWTNVNNALASDDSTAGNICTGTVSQYLKFTELPLGVPDGATIGGITIEIERNVVLNAVSDDRVRIVKGGVIGTEDKASGTPWVVTTDIYYVYGGQTDDWGETWTAADINAVDFGFVLSVEGTGGSFDIAAVDHARITIDYT